MYKLKDQFYTKPNVAKYCFKKFQKVASNLGVDLDKYIFVEPSAGCGSFYQLLPKNRRIGIDIEPKKLSGVDSEGIIKSDYLDWQPNDKKKKYVVVGNPPFGLRGKLALAFINKSYLFANMVAFILPQLFNSDGKGVAGKRVIGYKLAHNEHLSPDSFIYPDGEEIKINTVFQVWTKINSDKIKIKPSKTCNDFIDVYSLSDGGLPANTRNKDMIGKCDLYLPSTTFAGMKVYKSFYDLPHERGYGIVIKNNKKEIEKIFLNTDWEKVAFFSTNSALNLRTSLIKEIIIKEGYFDRKLI
ncbi:MAG: putative methyltransferase [Candidatus Berkelbacteria bacterium Athens1014_28]|uniref:Putative methyltransferase n=1 Tax=Candidatus Berkelbacteria bacterium Athens1014_28 TaxID=2017145 RepID=A0A554LPZ9_9BACT|nr:MAG: putative methyltransferase [Candidatus Berkelbacteria bacterium Athens1014_28]